MPWVRLESSIYWIVFAATFLLAAMWETARPFRKLANAPEQRWTRHGILLALSLASVIAVLRFSPVLLASMVQDSRYGLLNRLSLPLALRCAITVLALDVVHYWTHWTFHRIPWLWRVHEVHHSDPDYDISTGARFHPLEVIGTQASTLAAVALLAPPVAAVFLTELLVVILNFVEHANASMPAWMETLARRVIVTPDLHRIHHSERVEEQSRNFGQIFPWWDRLFGTYLGAPAAGVRGLVTGVSGLQNSGSLRIGFMLGEPFRRRSK
jgi:sterol desaturase/sphingolipid hydroxylase (fatty acid hydroxylase superfamily)